MLGWVGLGFLWVGFWALGACNSLRVLIDFEWAMRWGFCGLVLLWVEFAVRWVFDALDFLCLKVFIL